MAVLEITSKTDALKAHITKNRGRCRNCRLPVFWCKTSNGRKVPVDFPDQTLNPERTHELVVGWSEGVWDGTVEVWPASANATHTVHLDTCKRRA